MKDFLFDGFDLVLVLFSVLIFVLILLFLSGF